MELPVRIDGIEGIQALVGEPIGPTLWREVSQADIGTFAKLSGDDSVDPRVRRAR